MTYPAIDHGRKFRSARDAIFDLLSDLAWHPWKELETIGGNRYTARLLELRRLGYVVLSWELETGKCYRLESLQPGEPQTKRVKCYLDEADAASIVDAAPTDAARAAVADALASFRSNRGRL